MRLEFTAFQARCATAGLDLLRVFRRDLCQGAAQLPQFGRPDGVGILLGNTGALWTPFLQALRVDPRLAAQPHPLDAYVMATVQGALGLIPAATRVLWAHTTDPPWPVQHVAQVTGLAWLSPSHLSVHPRFGPWLGLRAIVLVDAPDPGVPRSLPPNPCATCAQPCIVALNAVCPTGAPPTCARVEDDWQAWLRVRDACPVGREHRYSDAQIAYHYTKARKFLVDSNAPAAEGGA